MLIHQACSSWQFDPSKPRQYYTGPVTDRPLYRTLAVTPEHLAEFAKLEPGEDIPVRPVASFAADRDQGIRSKLSARLVLADFSAAVPISAQEWVVCRDLAVDRVERSPTAPSSTSTPFRRRYQ
jgi:hypothetical protein